MHIVRTVGFVFVLNGMSQKAAIMTYRMKCGNINDKLFLGYFELLTSAKGYLLYYHVCECFGRGVLVLNDRN